MDLDKARALLDAKLALEAELVRPLQQVGHDYILVCQENGGRPPPITERMAHVERFEGVLLRHYCRVAMVVTGRRPPLHPSVNEAALSLRHMESMIGRAKTQALRLLVSIEREFERELAVVMPAGAAVDDGTGHPVAGKSAWDAAIETKADKEKVTGVTAGMVGRFNVRLGAIANVNTNGPAEEARLEIVNDGDENVNLVQEWRSLMDGRERRTHHEAHGQVRPIDQPFQVGGALLRFPGDTGLGAPLKEVINCRCFLVTYAVDKDGSRTEIHTGPSAPARRQRRSGDRVGPGERMPANPTSVVRLNGRTRATVVLGNGRLANLRQQTPNTIVVTVNRTTIARAETVGGRVTSIDVAPKWRSSGVEGLIRRSVEHSAAAAR